VCDICVCISLEGERMLLLTSSSIAARR